MSEKDKKSRYTGRVEVFAAKEEILGLLDAGYSYAMIFEKLTGEKRLTISYRQFCRCLCQYCGVKPRVQKNSPAPSKLVSPPKAAAGALPRPAAPKSARADFDGPPFVGQSGKVYARREDIPFGDYPEPKWLKDLGK